MKNEKELLELFFNEYALRDMYKSPFFCPTSNIVWATDGFKLISINSELLDGNYTEKEINPIKNIEYNCNRFISLSRIEKALSACDTEDEYKVTQKAIDCDECVGCGWVTWRYESDGGIVFSEEWDCPVCKGSGFSIPEKKEKTGAKTIAQYNVIKFGDGHFYARSIDTLAKAMRLVGVDKAKVTANHYNLASAFELCNGIVAMLMPICIDKAKVNTKVKAEIKLED